MKSKQTDDRDASKPASSKPETLRRILEAARLEFADKGMADTRIDDIAKAAGVTKQLIYHYYGNKESLFASVLDASSGDAMSSLLRLNLGDMPPTQALRAFLNHMIDMYCEDPTLSALAKEGIHYHDTHSTPRNGFIDRAPELTRKMRHILERGVENGDFRPDMKPDLLFAAAALVTTGAFTNRYTLRVLTQLDSAQADDAEHWRRFAVDFVLAAIQRQEHKD